MDLISGGTYDEVLPLVCLSVSTLERPVAAAAVSATQTHSPSYDNGRVGRRVENAPRGKRMRYYLTASELVFGVGLCPRDSAALQCRPPRHGFYKQNTAAPPSTSSSVNHFPVVLIARFLFIDVFIVGLTLVRFAC